MENRRLEGNLDVADRKLRERDAEVRHIRSGSASPYTPRNRRERSRTPGILLKATPLARRAA